MKNIYKEIHKKILSSNNIWLIWHKWADWDSIGSCTAFKEIINDNFLDKQVDILSFDIIPNKFNFIINSDIVYTPDFNKYDLFIYLDCSSVELSWFKNINTKSFLINIDHHPTNTKFWDINLINTEISSNVENLYNFFDYMNYKINKKASQSLLTWIYTDSWALNYSNTSKETLDLVSKLINLWWRIDFIYNNLFKNTSFEFLKLFSIVLDNLVIKNNVAISYFKKEDIVNSWCSYEECDWIIWRLNMLKNIDYILFIYEKENLVKWSLRTISEEIDLTKIAKKYWWWWHKKASWFSIKWKIAKNNGLFIKEENNNLLKIY